MTVAASARPRRMRKTVDHRLQVCDAQIRFLEYRTMNGKHDSAAVRHLRRKWEAVRKTHNTLWALGTDTGELFRVIEHALDDLRASIEEFQRRVLPMRV